jgi:fructose-1,6-bisphosphatase I
VRGDPRRSAVTEPGVDSGETPTLERHLAAEQRHGGALTPDLAVVLRSLAAAARTLARAIRRAAITGHAGLAGGTNVTGDPQKKLDLLGNEAVLEALAPSGLVAAVVSEEMPEARALAGPAGRFVLCTDPLDGSSNADVNGAVGTIFGVYPRARTGPIDPVADLLRAGAEQVLAGYVLYGPSTVLVYTAGRGSHGFTLDPDRDEFVLSHPNLRCPERGAYVSANLVRASDWEAGVQAFVASLTGAETAPGAPGRAWSLRYAGALVADVHRSLLEGGLFFYPSDRSNRDGKLRLLYECAPLAFVVEQAGGAASTGRAPIRDVRAQTLHQRVPLAIGSREDVRLYERFVGAGDLPAG